jgi:hypothetical protein
MSTLFYEIFLDVIRNLSPSSLTFMVFPFFDKQSATVLLLATVVAVFVGIAMTLARVNFTAV